MNGSINDLVERLAKAAADLEAIKEQHWEGRERIRLAGKVEGVRLALSYAREYQP